MNPGEITHVAVGRASTLEVGNRTARTGIDKRPVQSRVAVTSHGIESDVVSDTKHHGGVDQAVYLYLAEDRAWWARTLEHDLPPGTFGENLIVEGLADTPLRAGDVLHLPDLTLQVTAPRIPCSILAAHLGLPDFVKRFVDAGRPGVYLRVLREGTVGAGDAVRHEPSDGIPISDLYTEWYARPHDAARIARGLASPVAHRLRDRLLEWQEELAAPESPTDG